MSGKPWEPDRLLTPDIAKAVIGEACPDVDASQVVHLGSGWEFDAYLTADGWVFRFPRRREAQILFEREGPILALVREHLPPDVAVPRVERSGGPSAAFPYRFAGHRHLPGEAADALPESRRPTLAATLGAALGALHAIPLGPGRAAGLSEPDRPEEGRRLWFEQGLSGASSVLDPAVGEAVAWVRAVEDPLRRLEAPLCVIHDDLSPDHILADPASGRVTGIIDWTDAALGDPARDFVVLVAFGGWRFVESVLSAYTGEVDPGFPGRLRFMARLLSVMWLGEAYAKGEDTSKHVRWVRNAFAG